MKGLFIKDFYVLRKIMLYYAVIVVVFAGLGVITDNPAFIFGISIASSIGITLSAMAYDERDGWTAYAVASGISAKSVVFEKYFMGLICPVLCTLFAIIIYVCMGNTAIIPEIISYALCYPIVIEAICLPIVNKTGVEKGRARRRLLLLGSEAASGGRFGFLRRTRRIERIRDDFRQLLRRQMLNVESHQTTLHLEHRRAEIGGKRFSDRRFRSLMAFAFGALVARVVLRPMSEEKLPSAARRHRSNLHLPISSRTIFSFFIQVVKKY